ncbi:type IV secretion system DNA-binding domain-containing protein [Streptomyces sp. NPDC088196]|uniref:type IV secretory system conjugative DNA transfer family protein n=1 Tax=Streptomyces sp. NPDC088196 TaxID=3154868 RepID=UPI00344B6FE2
MTSLIWFDISITLSGLLVTGLFGARRWGQNQMDRRRITHEVIFPPNLQHANAARLFTSLRGLFPPVQTGRAPLGRPTFVVERLHTKAEGIRYLITFPPELIDVVRVHFTSTIPNISLRAVPPPFRRWTMAIELERPYEGIINVDTTSMELLLNSPGTLLDNEAVDVQVVMTPIGDIRRPESDPAFWAVVRIATQGEPQRAAYLLELVKVAYRGLQVFSVRRLPRSFLPRINDRASPTVRWGGAYQADTLPIVCGFPIDVDPANVPGLHLAKGRQIAPDRRIPTTGRVLARSTYISDDRPLALSAEDRLTHTYIVGPTKVGKSTLMQNMIVEDMKEGFGVAVFDPKGDLVENLLDQIPPHRAKDVVLFDLNDKEYPVGFNILDGQDPYAVTGQLTETFKSIFDLSQASTARAIDLLRNTVLALALTNHTLYEATIMMDSQAEGKALRARILPQLDNPVLVQFWQGFEMLSAREQVEWASPVLRRLRQIFLYPQLLRTLGQAQTGFNMRDVLQQNKILLVPLARGPLGDEQSNLVGAVALSKMWSEIQAREYGNRHPFFLYVDEFQDLLHVPNFFSQIAAQGRAFGVGVTLAHQHTGQQKFSITMRREVFANVRSKVVFRTTAEDARLFSSEFGSSVDDSDFTSLGKHQVIMQLTVDNQVTNPVTGRTLPPPEALGTAGAIRALSRSQYGKPREDVDYELETRHSGSHAPTSDVPLLPQPEDVGWETVEGA